VNARVFRTTGLTKRPASTTHSSPGRRSQMTMHKGIMESVKDQVVGSIKGTGEIMNTVVTP